MRYVGILITVPSLILPGVAPARQAWASGPAKTAGPSQTITRAGTQAPSRGPAEYFTGNVTIKPQFTASTAAPYSGHLVTFQAGARSAWHTHPSGQRLVVTAGEGRTAQWGRPIQQIKAGDVVWCPPGVKHWHGASPTTAMTHLALTGSVNNKNVVWLEKVTDTQYHAGTLSVKPIQSLSPKQQSIIPIAAFSATGDQEKLRTALAEGLAAGLTVNEVKEVLIQMYAYAGFPRSLSGIQTFMTLMDERQGKGIRDAVGKEASPLPAGLDRDEYGARVRAILAGHDVIPAPSGYQLFTPVIDQYLKEHLFADIFARDVLDHQSRELATISALASMSGTRSQLRFHLGAAMNVGLTEAQMWDFIAVLRARVGQEESQSASEVLSAVLKSR